jgi:hypothetical protein
MCVSGARDHSLAVWDISQLNDDCINNNEASTYQKSKCCTKFVRDAHKVKFYRRYGLVYN